MTAPRMDWHGNGGPPPPQHPYHSAAYDTYNHDPRAPPTGPGPYHPAGGYSPHRPGPPPPRIHPPKYWQEHQHPRRPPPPYGPPSMYDGPSSPAYHHMESRQGPPPQGMNPSYPDGGPPPYGPPVQHDYYRQRRDMYQPPPPFRTPPSHLRRVGDNTSVAQSSSFSSKEETPEVERTIPPKSSDWEPTRTKHEKDKKQGDPLSFLAKVAMGPSKSDQPTNDANKEVDPSQEVGDKTGLETITSPSKDDSEEISPLHSQLRSSPIITPNSVVVPPPSSVQPAPHPPVYRETSYPPSTSNTVTPKPITPTGTAHYGQPPSAAQPTHRPNHTPYGPYDDPRSGPYPPPYGMTPPHGLPPNGNYGPPPPGTYPSGYDSRSGSWEQPYVPPPNPSPAVVEERNSFDSYESSGNSRGSSQYYYPYYPEYPREHRGYPPYPSPATHGGPGWQPPPPPPPTHDPRTAGYPSPAWGGYEHSGYPPPPPGYPTPPPHHMTPPHGRLIGGQPPTPQYYDDRSYHMRPSSSGYGPVPPSRGYPYIQQPNRDEKTILRKKFSWKHFPELERFLIENRDDYLKFSSRNYTVEQKQFNNTLTERLIVLAEKHGYVFDPEEFNFVAIRDRIRCYYKSYVQTARKRGLMLPTDKSQSNVHLNKHISHDHDMGHEDDHDDNVSNEDVDTEGEHEHDNNNNVVTTSPSHAAEINPVAHNNVI